MNEAAKIGRNDPCPCGSGKKYKQCCLKTQQAQPDEEFLWRKIRRAIEGLPVEMLKLADSRCGKDALFEAWEDFMPWEDEPFSFDTPHMQIFMPWFYFDWLPDPHDTSVKREALDGRTLGQVYLDKKGRLIDPLLVRYIEQCCLSPFSFYDVLSVRTGVGFVLRDIMTGEEIDVTEHSGSRQAQAGDILFAKVVKIRHSREGENQVAMLEATAPLAFPPIEKGAILDLRKEIHSRKLPLTPQLLKEYIYDMLDIYHDISDRLLNPAMPQLQNTDGDPLLPHKLIYELACPAREALDALKQLNLMQDDENLLADAEFDPGGELRKIEFSWEKPGNKMHKNWDNTILGHIRIEGVTLTAEVNSEKRAQKFKAVMAELLPGKARYKTTVIESLQAMLAQEKKTGPSPQASRKKQELEDFNALPEVQDGLIEVMRNHYRDWLSQKLPVLKGRSPLQAVKTPDGREMVEALLMEFERRGKRAIPPLDPGIIAELREKLGLA